MKRLFIILITCSMLAPRNGFGQGIYYPPTTGTTWQTVDPDSLGWCSSGMLPLHDFLATSNSKAFIVLKDGRIALEWYFGSFTQDSLWYWASAGKSVTALLVGKAQEEGFLSISDTSAQYLGDGWTSCPPDKEEKITIRHQLTMTSGLDDGVPDVDCTDPACLQYLADAGTRWAYHNAPYTLLDGVISGATGMTLNGYLNAKLNATIGLGGLFVPISSNNVLLSKPRGMARYGLLMMTDAVWDGTPVLGDANYVQEMITPSQTLNPAYGYLWWLNGQSSYMLPGLQLQIPGPLMPNAPMDTYSAMGKNGQIINVSPDNGLVVVRMGDLPGGVFVPNVYNDQIWQYLNAVICAGTGTAEHATMQGPHWVPVDARTIRVVAPFALRDITVHASDGRTVRYEQVGDLVQVPGAGSGLFVLRSITPRGDPVFLRFVLE